jgi:hypothetical protein
MILELAIYYLYIFGGNLLLFSLMVYSIFSYVGLNEVYKQSRYIYYSFGIINIFLVLLELFSINYIFNPFGPAIIFLITSIFGFSPFVIIKKID